MPDDNGSTLLTYVIGCDTMDAGGDEMAMDGSLMGAEDGPNAPQSNRARVRGSSSCVLSPEKNPGEEVAETVIQFLETLKIPEGPKAGEPLQLAEFQRQFVRARWPNGCL